MTNPGPIYYLQGMKYVLSRDYAVKTPIIGTTIIDDWFRLDASGLLTIFAGFAWDGASGPTLDSKSSMSASLVHDVCCICMRDGRLSYVWQDTANRFFMTMCERAGMWGWRARVWHWGVKFGNAGNPGQGPDRAVLEAP